MLFRNFRILRLDSSAITTLEPGAFNGVTTLTQLSLKSNSIQSFPDNIFAPFASTIQKVKFKLIIMRFQCLRQRAFKLSIRLQIKKWIHTMGPLKRFSNLQ